jgi:hypothetical protein
VSSVLLLWVAAAALLLMVMLGVVVLIARHLDGSNKTGKQDLDAKLAELAARVSQVARSRDTPRWLSTTLASLGAASDDDRKNGSKTGPSPEERKQIKNAMTGLAIAGGVIMLVIGILTGNG